MKASLASAPVRRDRLALLAATLAYAALLLTKYRSVPDGLVNDQAEELLRGLILVAERRLEVLTFVVGNSAETLWLYVLGASAKLLGPTVLALALPSALAAAATAWLTVRFFLERQPAAPWWVPFLLAAGSPWLFHYGRSGLRAITAPFFVALVALLLQRAQGRLDRRGPFFSAGAVAGLSLYGYTAARLLPMALGVAFAIVFARDRDQRRAWRRAALAAAGGMTLASIPNLVFFAAHPVEFLVRGGYSVIGTAEGKLLNVLATLALPLHYPDRYRFVWGDAHVLDAFSASMTGSGVDPVPLAAGLLATFGLVITLRRSGDLTALFLVATHGLTVIFLGPFGPSLTRVLLLVPVLTFYAAVGTLELARTPRARLVAGAVLAAIVIASLTTYFRRLSDPGRQSRVYVGEVQTAMGERARVLAASGPVVAVVSDDGNVTRTLAWGTPTSVVEFRRRPFDYREVEAALPARTLLVETYPVFAPYRPPGFTETPSPDLRWRELTAEAAAIPPTGP